MNFRKEEAKSDFFLFFSFVCMPAHLEILKSLATPHFEGSKYHKNQSDKTIWLCYNIHGLIVEAHNRPA